jgi:hypothetical protein
LHVIRLCPGHRLQGNSQLRGDGIVQAYPNRTMSVLVTSTLPRLSRSPFFLKWFARARARMKAAFSSAVSASSVVESDCVLAALQCYLATSSHSAKIFL